MAALQPDDPRVVDFDAGILGAANADGQRQALQQGEVDLRVEALRLEGGEALGDGEEFLAHGGEVLQTLLQAEVGQIVGADLVAQEGGELLILLDEGMLPVGAKDVVPVLDVLERGAELALEPFAHTGAEDLGDLVGAKAPQPQLATAFEDLVDGKVAPEDQVAAILHLLQRVIHAFDIAGNLLFQHSMDAGDRWMLPDATGKPMVTWDFNVRNTDDGTTSAELTVTK